MLAALVALKGRIAAAIRSSEDATPIVESASRGDTLVALETGKWADKRTGQTVTWQAGDIGQVIWAGHFGTFYRSGYNKRRRSNCRVGVKFAQGVVFTGLDKFKSTYQPKTDVEINGIAHRAALDCGFSRSVSARHAWDTDNYALAFVRSHPETVAAWLAMA
jgi:hypothetical protein